MDTPAATVYAWPHFDRRFVSRIDAMTDGLGQPPDRPQNPATRIQLKRRPVPADSTRIQAPSSPAQAAAGVAEIQLTRIREAIREQNSSQGFARAKQAADKALAA